MFRRLIIALAALSLAGGLAGGYLMWRAHQTLAGEATDYLTENDQMLTVAGANVRVRMEGPADAPPVILLHGFIYSLESFDAWAADLKRDHRVIRFDLLGHGLSGPDPQKRYSPQERAAFIGDLMDALGIDRAIVGGNSLGGLAAWRFAAASPDRVSALILVSPGAYPNKGVAETPLSPPAPFALFLRNPTEAGVAFALQGVYADKTALSADDVRRTAVLMRRPGNGDAFVESIEEFSLPDPEPLLRSIAAPALILWGAEDQVIPVEQGAQMAAAISGAKLIVYPGVGHVAHEENAAQSIGDVRAFLADVESGAH